MQYRNILCACLFLGAINAQSSLTSECGTSTARGRPLVVNGYTPELGSFPWFVGLYKETKQTYEHICGGTLVGPDLVVTAAHCLYDDIIGSVEDVRKFMIAGGKFHRSYDSPEIYVQKSSVKSIDLAEKFVGIRGNYAADIALVRMETPFNITELVKPVCIDWDNKYESEQLQNGKTGKVLGWGITEKGEPSDTLKEINMPYIPYQACSAAVPVDFQGFITPADKFCAGYLNGTSACNGDAGGGLCFEHDGRWYLRGILSTIPASSGAALPCDNNQYAALTNVGFYREWIRSAYSSTG